MRSELDILKERGQSSRSDQTQPSPPDAQSAGIEYLKALAEFDLISTRFRTQQERSERFEQSGGVAQLMVNALDAAKEVRRAALALGQFPGNAISNPERGTAYDYSQIASTAEEGYVARIRELHLLEVISRTGIHASVPNILLAHEGQQSGMHVGHVLDMHVAWTITDFQDRFEKGGPNGQPYEILSAFLDQQTAEEVIGKTLGLHSSRLIRAVEGERLELDFEESSTVGYFIRRGDARPSLVKSGTFIVIKDSKLNTGYLIVTVLLEPKQQTI